MTDKKCKQIVELLSGIDIDIRPEDIKDIESVEELEEYLTDNDYFNVEMIYYSNAMNYLMENDPSLSESMQLASEMGYEVSSLTSETLASLLASDRARSDFEELKDELGEIYQ